MTTKPKSYWDCVYVPCLGRLYFHISIYWSISNGLFPRLCGNAMVVKRKPSSYLSWTWYAWTNLYKCTLHLHTLSQINRAMHPTNSMTQLMHPGISSIRYFRFYPLFAMRNISSCVRKIVGATSFKLHFDVGFSFT